tara:strand:- start:1646 stop:2179 length:534 start_codon:yes stop_codon:yes gene_type:complete
MAKVFVAIDVQNLWYGAREAFGNSYRVDFKALRELITLSIPDNSDVEAIAYAVSSPEHDNSRFTRMLELMGYIVKSRYMRYDKVRDTPINTDWDVGITVDTMQRSGDGSFDTFVLVSGDGDYSYLCEHLRNVDKRVLLFSFSDSTSSALKSAVDKSYVLDNRVVFDTHVTRRAVGFH